ncbi:MAG: RusA family crossover junction endodeoxyribonuclease [Candidatus Thorarchaeota archaeon]
MIKLILKGKIHTYVSPRIFKRGGRQIHYDPKAKNKKAIRIQCLKQYNGQIIDFPVEINYHFFLPIAKSFSKKKKKELIGGPHFKKPDCSNMIKFYEDCLKGTIIQDDCLVVRGKYCKSYGEAAEVLIDINKVCLNDYRMVPPKKEHCRP